MDRSIHHAVNGIMHAATTFKNILELEQSYEKEVLLRESARVMMLRCESCVKAFGGYEQIHALLQFAEEHGKCAGCQDFRCYFSDDAQLLLEIVNKYSDKVNETLRKPA